MLKKKKWWIILGCVLTVVILIIIFSFTVFFFFLVEIEYKTSSKYIENTNEEIIESGKFKYKHTVLIHNKNSYKYNIEEFNPYIKVVNIETVFPSKFVVHIAERQEIYAIEDDEKFYICDEEMRVLRIVKNFESDTSNAMLLRLEEKLSEEYEEGDYILETREPNIYRYLFENNRLLGEQQAFIQEVTLLKEHDETLKKDLNITLLKFFSGQTFKIVNDNYGMKYKVKLMIDVYSQLYDFIGKEISSNGQKVVLKEEDLKDCTILISNYYDLSIHKENECFFNILLKEKEV